jgi:hypothetical protein
MGTEDSPAQALTNGGNYVVDERAVADAMLAKLTRGELPRSAVLVPRKATNRRAGGVRKNGAAPGPSLA